MLSASKVSFLSGDQLSPNKKSKIPSLLNAGTLLIIRKANMAITAIIHITAVIPNRAFPKVSFDLALFIMHHSPISLNFVILPLKIS